MQFTRVLTRTSGEAVPQAPANHSIKERDQEFMCTQATTNYDKRRVPCGKIKVRTNQYATTWIFGLVQLRQNCFTQAV